MGQGVGETRRRQEQGPKSDPSPADGLKHAERIHEGGVWIKDLAAGGAGSGESGDRGGDELGRRYGQENTIPL